MNIYTLQRHLWDIPLSFEGSGWDNIDDYNDELEHYGDWSDIEVELKSFFQGKASISNVRELVEDYFNSPSMSAIIFGCECGCGGSYYTHEQWRDKEMASEKAMKKLKEIGVKFDES